ncbi:hypothetical protein I5M27_17575 [Adhaeribacter sp. BT258]|uniref:Tissue inhibitor of metalloproteinase n=1 Tax=Adhaeribacter terrigena TaxID=2793070 RepID=A0ABS1C609_9BACT|nr:hypothetical protein [Adhaeribacter terrigena]MBK0404806.1 hypothetical protein [Adhaeribacter terrigena]
MKILLTVILLSIFPNHLFACDCNGTVTVKEELDKSNLVFVGNVISISPIYAKRGDKYYTNVLVKFKISSIIKGESLKTVEIATAASSSMCGFNFKEDKEFLVYSNQIDQGSKKVFWTTNCDRTKEISKATFEIKELNALIK